MFGFKSFFVAKLKATGLYDNAEEIKYEVENAIENMEYDQSNGDSLMLAFEKACRDLYIETDGIESYL